MALGAERGGAVLKSAAVLVDGCLQVGLTDTEYRDVLDAAGEIARAGLSHNSAYEALEVVEIARQFVPVNLSALDTFTLSVVTDLTALRARLTPGQRIALAGLAREVGWEYPEESSQTPAAGGLSDLLNGAEIAIYTLTENAGRQAKQNLLEEAPGVRVELNHEHGGSSSLAALAVRADLFVIAWASAAHAATDFIREKRGKKSIVYAAGKGAASIVRAVEDWARGEAGHHGGEDDRRPETALAR